MPRPRRRGKSSASCRPWTGDPIESGNAFVRSRILLTVLAVSLGVIHPVTCGASDVTLYGTDGHPLPFAGLDEIERFLETAEIVSDRPLHTGRSGPRKLVLEQDGVRAAAAFNASDAVVRGVTRHFDVSVSDFHDFHQCNCAAYRLDRLLGLNRVPPTVHRDIGQTSGSVSLWIENTITEKDREDRGLQPPDLFRWNQQKKIMVVFDNLIGNVDRNKGNILIDRSWSLWFIDHTRAFITASQLTTPKTLNRCERGLYTALQELDPEVVREELSPFLTGPQIDAVFIRRDLILQRLEQEIDRFGKAVVLFDLLPPDPDLADWSRQQHPSPTQNVNDVESNGTGGR